VNGWHTRLRVNLPADGELRAADVREGTENVIVLDRDG